jgi:hypothetical protein
MATSTMLTQNVGCNIIGTDVYAIREKATPKPNRRLLCDGMITAIKDILSIVIVVIPSDSPKLR